MYLARRCFLLLAPLLLLAAACTKPAASPQDGASAGASAPAPGVTASATEATPSPSSSPTRTPEPSPTPVATPPSQAKAPIGQDMLTLQQALQAAVDAYWVPGVYAFAVTDLQTGETVSVRGGEPHLSGCALNLFVLYQVAADVEAGRYPLETVDGLVRATTWSSNARTARDLYLIAGDGDGVEGVRRVQTLIGTLALDADILIDHPPAYHEHSLGIDYNNYVTADSLNRALAALWHGEVVDGAMRDYLLEVLQDVKPGLNYLTAVVPEGSVSHKNGFFVGDNGYVDNDAGIVRLQRGDEVYAYAVTFLSEQVPSEYGDVALGQQLGALAYEIMAARYPPEEAS